MKTAAGNKDEFSLDTTTYTCCHKVAMLYCEMQNLYMIILHFLMKQHNAHGQEMEPIFSMMLGGIFALFCSSPPVDLFLCFPVFQSCAPTTKRVQSELQFKKK